MRSTKTEIEAFKESMIWQDILEEVEDEIKFYQSQLLNIPAKVINNDYSTTSVMTNIGCMHGTIETFTLVRDSLLDILINKYEEQQKQKNLSQENDENA